MCLNPPRYPKTTLYPILLKLLSETSLSINVDPQAGRGVESLLNTTDLLLIQILFFISVNELLAPYKVFSA